MFRINTSTSGERHCPISGGSSWINPVHLVETATTTQCVLQGRRRPDVGFSIPWTTTMWRGNTTPKRRQRRRRQRQTNIGGCCAELRHVGNFFDPMLLQFRKSKQTAAAYYGRGFATKAKGPQKCHSVHEDNGTVQGIVFCRKSETQC